VKEKGMGKREKTIVLGSVTFELMEEPGGATGWSVRITRAGIATVEIHDFRTRAAARTWVVVNAHDWIASTLRPEGATLQ
jgi:hypothetical protein